MTRYIKGDNGRFQGSIGDGRDTVPTESVTPSVYAQENTAATVDYQSAHAALEATVLQDSFTDGPVSVDSSQVPALAFAAEETMRATGDPRFDGVANDAVFRVRQLASGETVDAEDVVDGLAAIANLYDSRHDEDDDPEDSNDESAGYMRDALNEVAAALPSDIVCAVAMRTFGREYRYSHRLLELGENPLTRY